MLRIDVLVLKNICPVQRKRVIVGRLRRRWKRIATGVTEERICDTAAG